MRKTNVFRTDEQNTKNIISSLEMFLKEMMGNRGITSFPHNQLSIIEIPEELSQKILAATGGATVVKGKYFALEASKLFHEIMVHSDFNIESQRGQLPYGIKNIYQILDAMINPDVIEDVSHGDSLDQRNTFAVIKENREGVVVVLSVGGKRNPNVTPQQIIFFQQKYWKKLRENRLTVREIIYGNNSKRKNTDFEFINNIKKNRVTVAHHEF